MKLPLSCPDITDAERQAVQEVLLTPHLSLGPKLTEFEQLFARYIGTRYAAAINSGTSGLHLCVSAMGIGPGDEVITTPFSFVASSNCVLFERATPVFVDIDPDTWNIDPARIRAAITPRTKALIPVDVFGQPPDMDSIREIAAARKLRIIEDSCEALGASYKGKPAGRLGDVGVFGFYPNKQLTTGEGGMVVTDDEQIHKLVLSMRNQGRDPNAGWLAHARLGYNFRLSEINCAMGIAQLKRMDEILERRRRVAGLYAQKLQSEKRIRLQKVLPGCTVSPFVLVIRLDDRYTRDDRDRIMDRLKGQDIGCNNYFTPIHLQPFYVAQFGYKRGDFPITEALSDRTIALPFHGLMTEPQVDHSVAALRQLL